MTIFTEKGLTTIKGEVANNMKLSKKVFFRETKEACCRLCKYNKLVYLPKGGSGFYCEKTRERIKILDEGDPCCDIFKKKK